LNISQPIPRSGGAIRLSTIARLVRRICLLRELGDAVAAAHLEENEFATAVRDIRLTDGPDALPEGGLQAMFVNEERRVADAVVLAELLIPQLAASILAGNNTAPRPPPTSDRKVADSFSRAADPVAGSPAIPDLLDAMLAADAAARRQSASRRAS